MDLYVAAICFPIIFIGELPDKTMFANLVMATRGRPLYVWTGAALAFAVHVAIATTVGVALYRLVPHRALDALVATLFLAGAGYAWYEGGHAQAEDQVQRPAAPARSQRLVATAFIVIFLAEWGDLTQVLTAELAARYHSALSVGTGALAALWAVAAIAVGAGQALGRHIDVTLVRRVTAFVLAVLGALSLYSALR